jgi:hypothetical protein
MPNQYDDPRNPNNRKNPPRTSPAGPVDRANPAAGSYRSTPGGAVNRNKSYSGFTIEDLAKMYKQRVPTGPARPPVRPPSGGVSDLLRGDRERQSRYNVGSRLYSVSGDASQYPTGDEIINAVLGSVGATSSGGGGGGGGRGAGGGGGGGGMAGPSKKDINEAIKAMQDAATAAQTKIGGIYDAANQTLSDLTARYAASEAAARQGAGRTLGAFGVSGGVLDPMAQTAADYLTTSQGTLTGLSAAQQAQLEAQKAAYALIMGDLLKGR